MRWPPRHYERFEFPARKAPSVDEILLLFFKWPPKNDDDENFQVLQWGRIFPFFCFSGAVYHARNLCLTALSGSSSLLLLLPPNDCAKVTGHWMGNTQWPVTHETKEEKSRGLVCCAVIYIENAFLMLRMCPPSSSTFLRGSASCYKRRFMALCNKHSKGKKN